MNSQEEEEEEEEEEGEASEREQQVSGKGGRNLGLGREEVRSGKERESGIADDLRE